MTNDSVTLSWSPADKHVKTYSVQSQVADGEWTNEKTGIKGTKETLKSNPAEEKLYRVVAVNEYGESEPTNTVKVAKRAGQYYFK